jgi:hypothetical protein
MVAKNMGLAEAIIEYGNMEQRMFAFDEDGGTANLREPFLVDVIGNLNTCGSIIIVL